MPENFKLQDEQQRKARKGMDWAEQVICQTHYSRLSSLEALPLPDQVQDIRPGDVICLFQIKELVFDRKEGSLAPLSIVLNSLHACGASCILILQYQGGRSELYIGAVNKLHSDNPFYLSTIREALRSGIEGNMPGTELDEVISRRGIEERLGLCIDNGFDSQCITAISCVAQEDEHGSVQGIEHLLEAIGDRNFTLMILADPVDRSALDDIRRGYEDLSSELSALESFNVSYQSGNSTTLSESHNESIGISLGRNVSMTQTRTTGTGWSAPEDSAEARRHRTLTAGAGLALLRNPIQGASYVAMQAMNAMAPQARTVTGQDSHAVAAQQGENENISNQIQKGESIAKAVSTGTTVSYTAQDRHVKGLLERIEKYLQWLGQRENLGMFNCCAYVISSNAGTNQMVASQYQALMQGRGEIGQSVSINTWTAENGVDRIRSALARLSHPVFDCPDISTSFTPAMLVSSKELSKHLALPQKSVVGVSTMEYAAFGREVVRKTPLESGKVFRVGSIYHMGHTIERQPVILDLQSMAAHTFVAGTNGSGKSNTVFRMIEEFQSAGIPFLIIEPAKGEYKNVFGRDTGVRVYGVNRRKSAILRINPFWFNEDVSVLEHIDKMIEVFNASWSMTAAMPAVLKAAIENAYAACGWNLAESTCPGRRIFPTVEDVLDEFNNKMNSTAFSQEVKGNYVGALSTRMESLCNGIYGEIFGGGNLTDEELFNSSVIIDLSRVGSSETKAMIMGILLIRLQEYRMTSEAMNLPLCHVTILEEAHHLLRRTSTAQSSEGSNVLGKSVEMISNAIAEMRSYGEGFVIVDQSPGLLDMSVMRNTNTKLILRLPESGDREMVGNTMGLSPEQIYELSRLKTGVCAIYQKDWTEAVLCQVDHAIHKETPYAVPADFSAETRLRGTIAIGLRFGKDNEDLRDFIAKSALSGKRKIAILQSLSSGDKELRERLAGQLDEYRQKPPTTAPTIDPRLREDRGLAFAWLSPPDYRKKEPEDRDRLWQCVRRLATGNDNDKMLSSLLETFLKEGTFRNKGELKPYTEIAWNYYGGMNAWDSMSCDLAPERVQEWDTAARRKLGEQLTGSQAAVTSVLSLVLQKKGAEMPVRVFFPVWIRYATRTGQNLPLK